MRYCLACRYISGNGPLCTRCGRSFGGRLCGGKKRHLNPPDALYCGECGSQDLTESAEFLPLGCPIKLLLLAAVGILIWKGAGALTTNGLPGFTSLTGYRSFWVWLIENSVKPLVFLFLVYFLLGLFPGRGGRQLQKLFGKLCAESVRFVVTIICKSLTAILRALSGTPTKQ